MRVSHRTPLFVVILSVVLAVPALAGEAAPADDLATDATPAVDAAPAEVDLDGPIVTPDALLDVGISEVVEQALTSEPCGLPEGEFYYMCTGATCYDGDICVRKCDKVTHDCCYNPECVDPSTMCFE